MVVKERFVNLLNVPIKLSRSPNPRPENDREKPTFCVVQLNISPDKRGNLPTNTTYEIDYNGSYQDDTVILLTTSHGQPVRQKHVLKLNQSISNYYDLTCMPCRGPNDEPLSKTVLATVVGFMNDDGTLDYTEFDPWAIDDEGPANWRYDGGTRKAGWRSTGRKVTFLRGGRRVTRSLFQAAADGVRGDLRIRVVSRGRVRYVRPPKGAKAV